MISFKQVYTEALALKDVNSEPADKEVSVFMGRMQPPTIAHVKIIEDTIKKYKNPVVVAVVKSGNDKSPFSFKLVKSILEKSVKGDIEVIELKTGFIGDFISPLRANGMEPTILMAGSDRVKGYQGQIKRYKDQFNLNLDVKEIKRTGADVSATKVRQAIKDGDEETFKSMTPKGEWSFFKKLQKEL